MLIHLAETMATVVGAKGFATTTFFAGMLQAKRITMLIVLCSRVATAYMVIKAAKNIRLCVFYFHHFS